MIHGDPDMAAFLIKELHKRRKVDEGKLLLDRNRYCEQYLPPHILTKLDYITPNIEWQVDQFGPVSQPT